ncbi:MAG: hypothetical protein AAFY11_08515 [Cyanobacteria bacterium J06641_5]
MELPSFSDRSGSANALIGYSQHHIEPPGFTGLSLAFCSWVPVRLEVGDRHGKDCKLLRHAVGCRDRVATFNKERQTPEGACRSEID